MVLSNDQSVKGYVMYTSVQFESIKVFPMGVYKEYGFQNNPQQLKTNIKTCY